MPSIAPRFAIGGKTWRVLGKIRYVALTERLKPEADFDDFARATTDIAGELYGNGGEAQGSALRVHAHGAHPQSQAAAAGCRGDRERIEVASASLTLTLEDLPAPDALGALLSIEAPPSVVSTG